MKAKHLRRVLAVSMAAAMSLAMCGTTAMADDGTDNTGGMGMEMPPGGEGGMTEGDISGAASSDMPSEENVQLYYSDETDPIEITNYGFYSETFADSAIAATGCTSITVGGSEVNYSTADVAALSGTTAEYINKYAAGDDGFNGYIVLGAEDNGSTAGNGISVDSGTLYVTNMYIQTSGAIGQNPSGRYGIATLGSATTIVNDSYVIHTGATEATDENSVPPSNAALTISGRGRSNFSIGETTTMYFNSTVVAEGWAAMSTDSATGDGLDFYSYNSAAYAENGGYGLYADTNCRDYLYATYIESAEIGVIISNNGSVYVGSGADASAEILAYNTGATSDAASVIKAGRNDYQLHSPDMMGDGTSGYQAQVIVENSTLITTRELQSTMDYTEEYDEAVGAYIEYVSGANILVKSTGAVIDLDNVTAESYSDTLLLTALNSDSMSRYLTSEGTDDVEMTISNSVITGDIQHDDYQRDVSVVLENTDYTGAVDYSTYDEWNAMWESVEDCEYNYWSNLDPDTYITDTHNTDLSLVNSAWTVDGDSHITSLTMDEASSVVVPEGVTLVVDEGAYAGTYTGETIEVATDITVTVSNGSNGTMLQSDEQLATVTLTPDSDMTLTVYTLGEAEEVAVSAGESYTVSAPSVYDEDGVAYKLALTVDGVETSVDDGTVTGSNIAVSIVKGVYDEYESHGQATPRWITTAIYADDEGVNLEYSVLAAVTVDGVPAVDVLTGGETELGTVAVSSENDYFSAIRTGGNATLTVDSVDINLIGNGGDDFTGIGSALAAADNSTLVVNGGNIYTQGILRSALFAGDYGTLELNNITIQCEPGEYQTDVDIPSAGMASPPNGLGIWGNCRALNMVDNGTVIIDNSTIISQNWGALGVDDVEDGHLTVSNSRIVIEEQGYGSYAIGKCVDTFTNCVFEINYGVVGYAASGDGAEIILNGGTVANSLNYYGIITHQSFNGANTRIVVTGEGTELNAKYAGILAKGRGADIEISDGATVTATEGVLVRAQINDDTGAGSMDGTEVVNVTISDTSLEGDIVQAMGDATGSNTSTMNVTMSNASLTGEITTAVVELMIADGNISMDNITDVGLVSSQVYMDNEYALLNVTMDNGSVWTLTEDAFVDTLTLDESSSVVIPEGVTLTVDSGDYAGVYTNTVLTASAGTDDGQGGGTDDGQGSGTDDGQTGSTDDGQTGSTDDSQTGDADDGQTGSTDDGQSDGTDTSGSGKTASSAKTTSSSAKTNDANMTFIWIIAVIAAGGAAAAALFRKRRV